MSSDRVCLCLGVIPTLFIQEHRLFDPESPLPPHSLAQFPAAGLHA